MVRNTPSFALKRREETFFTAIDPAKAGGSVVMPVGQQSAKYAADLLVGKDVVVKAAKLFAQTEKLEPGVVALSRVRT